MLKLREFARKFANGDFVIHTIQIPRQVSQGQDLDLD